MGVRKKPIDLKVLRMTGAKAARLLSKKTPTPGALVDPPEWFTPDQKADWEYAIENAPVNVLRRIDKAVLAGFIVAQDAHRRASIEIQRELVVASPKQSLPIQNAYLPIVNRQYLLMLKAANELGFSPTSRARIDAGNPAAAPAGEWEDVSA